MKPGTKLVAGVAFAAITIAVSQTPYLIEKQLQPIRNAPCYSEREVQTVMKANGWTKEETKTILDLACEYSNKREK